MLRQMVDWQKDVRSSGEFVERVKVDVFRTRSGLHTQRRRHQLAGWLNTGRFRLPHPHGRRSSLVGAKVNDRIVPIDTELVTGDRVQIITSRNSGGPKSDWLKFVKAASTKAHIRAYLRKKELEHSTPERPEMEERPRPIVMRSPLSDRRTAPDSGFRIVVRGDATLPIVMAACCNPAYPDEILGYVTRGRGVTIHRADCANIPSLAMEPERLVDAHWEMIPRKARERTIVIETLNVPGVLYQVSEEFAKRDINIKYIEECRAPLHVQKERGDSANADQDRCGIRRRSLLSADNGCAQGTHVSDLRQTAIVPATGPALFPPSVVWLAARVSRYGPCAMARSGTSVIGADTQLPKKADSV